MIVDAHCYVGRYLHGPKVYSIDQDSVSEEMNRSGVDKAIVCASGPGANIRCQDGNDMVSDFVRRGGGRFLGWASVNPWLGDEGVSELDRAVTQLHLIGLNLHPLVQGFELNSPLVYQLIERTASLMVPVYLHAGPPLLAVPYKVADLADIFPDVKIILGHLGHDYHFDIIPATKGHDNILLETSLAEATVLKEAYRQLGAERLIFGSEYPVSRMEIELKKVLGLPQLVENERELILSGNVSKLIPQLSEGRCR